MGKNGHVGATLKKVNNPYRAEMLREHRRKLPKGQYRHVGYQTRQVFDIDIARAVTEYQAEVVADEKGHRIVAPFPEGVTQAAQYEEGVKAHAVYLSQFQLRPYNRIQDYFADQFMIYKNRMNLQILIKFMQRLIKGSKKKIFLILDNLKVHHRYKVQAWLENHEAEIRVFFLPSYTPEVNPDEYLNCDLKSGVHSDLPARDKNQLCQKALSHLRKLQKLPHRVMKYFKHPKIAYAA